MKTRKFSITCHGESSLSLDQHQLQLGLSLMPVVVPEEERMAQGMENTVSNGQGSKPHSAIEKGEEKISSE